MEKCNRSNNGPTRSEISHTKNVSNNIIRIYDLGIYSYSRILIENNNIQYTDFLNL